MGGPLILRVLAEGPSWVIVDKPGNVLVHRNEHDPYGPAVLQALRDQLRRPVYPVHRLDRGVSGCLLFALDGPTAGLLSQAMPTAEKTYVALVRGEWRHPATVDVDRPMKDDNGIEKAASSRVTCLSTQADPRCSVVRVEPRTGRFHQVRRHLRDLGHPVIGDVAHGDNKINRAWRALGASRVQLHCLALALGPPWAQVRAEAPLHADHLAAWSAQPLWEAALVAEPRLRGSPPGTQLPGTPLP